MFSNSLAEGGGSVVCASAVSTGNCSCEPFAVHHCIQFCNYLFSIFFARASRGQLLMMCIFYTPIFIIFSFPSSGHRHVNACRCSFLFTPRRQVSRGCHRRCARISCALRACGEGACNEFPGHLWLATLIFFCVPYPSYLLCLFPALGGPIKVCETS